MFDVVGLISFIALLIILFAVSYAAIIFGVKSKKLASEIVQLHLDKIALLDKLDKEINANESKSLEQTDGFVRFLSESREWAFSYIENVQQAISELKISVENGYEQEQELIKLFSFLPENKQGE